MKIEKRVELKYFVVKPNHVIGAQSWSMKPKVLLTSVGKFLDAIRLIIYGLKKSTMALQTIPSDDHSEVPILE